MREDAQTQYRPDDPSTHKRYFNSIIGGIYALSEDERDLGPGFYMCGYFCSLDMGWNMLTDREEVVIDCPVYGDADFDNCEWFQKELNEDEVLIKGIRRHYSFGGEQVRRTTYYGFPKWFVQEMKDAGNF